MSILAIPFFFFIVFGFVVAVLSRRAATASSSTEPACGNCGYCVRGISELICPECGSDLREVGIRTPGTGMPRPLTPRAKLVMWSTMMPLTCLSLLAPLAMIYGPNVLLTTQRRTIFCQAKYLNATLDVVRETRMVAMGRKPKIGAPPQKMTIKSASMNPMDVDLATGNGKFTDRMGRTVAGAFNAKFIEQWLNAFGFIDPRIAERADDLITAIKDMDTASSPGFLKLANDPQRGNLPSITAHPSFMFTRTEPSGISMVAPVALTALIWLIGLPFFLKGRKSAGATPSDPA